MDQVLAEVLTGNDVHENLKFTNLGVYWEELENLKPEIGNGFGNFRICGFGHLESWQYRNF